MLREQLDISLKEGLKAKDGCTVSTVRLIRAAIKERDISARGKSDNRQISDSEIQVLLQTMVKQRNESIEMYTKGGREDLAAREAQEIEVIKRFLPKQMDEEAIRDAVDAIIQETGASGLKEMGIVMAALRERHQGAMDFSKAGAIAKVALS